jgi:hypothetical protein
MRFRKLRIAWSVAWGIMAAASVFAWIRTQYWIDNLVVPISHSRFLVIGTEQNRFGIGLSDESPNGAWCLYKWPIAEWRAELGAGTTERSITIPLCAYAFHGKTIPYWPSLLLSAVIATCPWVKRFSLRTLLIAMTLVAVILGAIVFAVK